MKRLLKKKRFYIILVCLFFFLLLMILVLKKGILNIDNEFYKFVKDNLINDKLTPYIKIITEFGGAILLISLTIIFIIIFKNKKISYAILINLGLVFIFSIILKIIIQRDRPDSINWLINEIGYSFPSSHSAISMAYYGFLIYLVNMYLPNKKYKWSLIIFLSIIILAVGISRIYLGVHYLSDVIAGFLFAIIYLIVFVFFFNKISKST